jgi:hypothetical protein
LKGVHRGAIHPFLTLNKHLQERDNLSFIVLMQQRRETMTEAIIILPNMRGGCATVGDKVHTLFRVNNRRPRLIENKRTTLSPVATAYFNNYYSTGGAHRLELNCVENDNSILDPGR